MVFAGDQIEMQHQQLGNCNLIGKGPFAGVQSWERSMGNIRLCYAAEARIKAVLLLSVPCTVVPFDCTLERFDPTPWRLQEFRNHFCSWIKV